MRAHMVSDRWQGETYITHGFRTEGLYRLNGAELEVRTTMTHKNEGVSPLQQHISVTGRTEESVYEIYALVRGGNLAPYANGEAPEFWRGPSPTEKALEKRIAELEARIMVLELGIMNDDDYDMFDDSRSSAPDDPGSVEADKPSADEWSCPHDGGDVPCDQCLSGEVLGSTERACLDDLAHENPENPS